MVEGATLPQHLKPTLIIISGCSGGGKSTLLAELARRGHPVFAEPGRDIVKEELAKGGDALPWTNTQRFAERCIEYLKQAQHLTAPAFFDRSIVEAVSALEHLGRSVPAAAREALDARPYDRRVLMAPPWPELFENDAERRHTFEDARAEYDRLLSAYTAFGHEIVLLPKTAVTARADFVARMFRPRG